MHKYAQCRLARIANRRRHHIKARFEGFIGAGKGAVGGGARFDVSGSVEGSIMSERGASSNADLEPNAKRRLLSGAAVLGVAAALSACASGPRSGPIVAPPPVQSGTQVVTREGVTPPFMAGRPITRIGLMLPFSSRPADAAALYSAAELALFDHGGQGMLLIPRDSGGDEAAAMAAGQALVRDGADIVIGPVLRDGVEGVARVVRPQRIPVIGFSSDRTVAGNGVYLLSFQLEDEISRLVSYAASRGITTVALLAPANEYGRRVDQALRREAQARGVRIVVSDLYTRSDQEAGAAARRVAQAVAAAPVQGIIIAESGTALRAIGPALVQGGVNFRQTRLLGTSAWAGGDVHREPTLAGGWYVAPDPSARTEFEQRYRQAYGQTPTRLASLSYDAVALASLLSADRGSAGFSRQGIERNEGFLGSDGVFRFRPDGSIERGLAIMEVRAGGSTPVDPAPRRFTAPAS
jgi:ABC-type branched-subunit amino acid transport system substrate-binding protein